MSTEDAPKIRTRNKRVINGKKIPTYDYNNMYKYIVSGGTNNNVDVLCRQDQDNPHIILLSNVNPDFSILMSLRVLDALTGSDREQFEKNKHSIYFFEKHENISTAPLNLRDIFAELFPLLKCRGDDNAPNVLKMLLGEVLKMSGLDEELQRLFKHATNVNSLTTKFTSLEKQNLLSEAFNHHMSINHPKAELTEPHYQQLIEKISPSCGGNRKQANALMCLSAVFVKYSSSAIFGTDDDSPRPLRLYASALLDKAVKLDPDFLPESVPEWQNRLLGLEKAYSCTSVLFGIMKEKLLGSEESSIARKIIPPTWH